MKKLNSTFGVVCIIIVFLSLVYGCSKPTQVSTSVSACIEPLPSTGVTSYPVTFISCTSAGMVYNWNFGDGTTAEGNSVAHDYENAGTYTGSLVVTGSSNSSTKNFTINVVPFSEWSVQSNNITEFSSDSVVAYGSGLTAFGSFGTASSALSMVFPSLPAVAGSYTIVNPVNGAANNQVFLILYIYSGGVTKAYGSTGSGNNNVAVTLINGKVSASLPILEMVNQSNASDSLSVQGSITQTQ